MKLTKTIFHLSLVVIMGLIVVTCQKEETLMLNPEGETDIDAPQLKSVVYNEFHWYHLDLVYYAINDMVEEGSLSKGNANALMVKYNAARDNLWKGKYDTAEGILTAFINLVGDLIEEGKILPEQGEQLVQVPGAIIESFKHQCGDPVYDVRDGQTYETVQIGDQCWLAENLNFDLNGWLPENLKEKTESSFYYNNDPGNGSIYGRLYNPTGNVLYYACPIGWHMPSDEEWKTLERYLGMSDADADAEGIRYSGDVGMKLKSTSGWKYYGNGINSVGFNALPGGHGIYNIPEDFYGLGTQGFFLSSTSSSRPIYWTRILWSYRNGVERIDLRGHYAGSVRCVKND